MLDLCLSDLLLYILEHEPVYILYKIGNGVGPADVFFHAVPLGWIQIGIKLHCVVDIVPDTAPWKCSKLHGAIW